MLLRSKLENLRIGERPGGGVGGKAQHVVTSSSERCADPFGQEVGVEQQPRSGLDDLDEEMEHAQLIDRPAVLGDEPVDLVGIRDSAGERQPHVRGERWVCSRSASTEPMSSALWAISQTSSPEPMTHPRRFTSSPRNAIPGIRRSRTASR